AVVAHDEDRVALDGLALGGELGEVDAARPVRGDRDRRAGLPLADPQAVRVDQRILLDLSGERAEVADVPRARAAVVAHAVEVDGELGLGVRADVEGDRLAGADAAAGEIALDPGAAVLDG